VVGNQNVVAGNLIGTTATGLAALDNGAGIYITGNSNTIGGATASARNIISGNLGPGSPSSFGINIDSQYGVNTGQYNLVEGNYIGPDITGTTSLPQGAGIYIAGHYNTIGGTTAGARNIISGNNEQITIFTSRGFGNAVLGNYIGTDASGTQALGNSQSVDVLQGAYGNTIGGTTPGAGNIIAFNGSGVDVESGTGDSILGNSIFANRSPGIFLNGANNANNNQAFPVLTEVSSSSSGTTISGTLASVAGTTFRLEFFANQSPDPSGYGQGQTFLGYANVTNGTFTATGLAALPAGQNYLSATATNLSTGDTSPFAQDLLVAPTVTTVTSSANPSFFGQAVTFTASVAATVSGAGTPTGSVVFVDTTTGLNLGTVTLANGSATVTTSSLAAGANTITAQYSGGSTVGGSYGVVFLPGSGSLIQTVLPTIFVLNPTASGALSLSGNASINIPGSVLVDSGSNTALTEGGNAQINAAGIQVVGGARNSGNATWSPVPVTGVASVADPLATLAAPTSGTSRGSVNLGGSSALTLNPGIYTQISASGSARLTLNPGVYILAGGGLTVSGNASVSGSGVTFYNTESAFPNPGGTYGGITLSGNGTFNLTAPTSGPYAGVVIFQARTNTRAISLSGNAVEALGGTIYAKAALLYLSGNATLAGAVVVNELSLTGNAASTQAADASDVSGGDAAGQLLAGILEVYVDNSNNLFTADELARIQAAISAVDAVVEPYSVSVAATTDRSVANVVIDTGSTSAVGGYQGGILGCYTTAGEITLIQGWNWYAGSNAAQISANQYDFQTTLTHELGHALGLGESEDATSAMYGTLAPGTAIRTLTTADLSIPYNEGDGDPQRAADPPPTMLLTSASAAVLRPSPSVADVRTVPSGRVPVVAAVGSLTARDVLFATTVNAAAPGAPSADAALPSLASRDALFALLAAECLPRPGELSIDLSAGGAFTTPVGRPTPVPDREWTRAGTVGEAKAVDHLTLVTLGSNHGLGSERSAVGLWDGAESDDESQSLAAATD
jgi:hypothetical protein